MPKVVVVRFCSCCNRELAQVTKKQLYYHQVSIMMIMMMIMMMLSCATPGTASPAACAPECSTQSSCCTYTASTFTTESAD